MESLALAARIKARYLENKKRFEIPELHGIYGDDKPFVFWSHLFTINDEKVVGPFMAKDDPEGYAHAIKIKAQDESGRLLFGDDADLSTLCAYMGARAVKRIANEIYEYSIPKPDDALGNSPPIDD